MAIAKFNGHLDLLVNSMRFRYIDLRYIVIKLTTLGMQEVMPMTEYSSSNMGLLVDDSQLCAGAVL